MADNGLALADLYDAWPVLSFDERTEAFELLQRSDAEEFFLRLGAREKAQLLSKCPLGERRLWIRLLPPDDAADLVRNASPGDREEMLGLLDDATRGEIKGLLDYLEDQAGGLMNPRYARLRPDMTVNEAISYLRRDARDRTKNVYYAYVLDPEERLLGVVSFRDLLTTVGDKLVSEVMRTSVVSVSEHMDQEELSHVFSRYNIVMVPIVDAERRIKGVVTSDDIMDVVREETTRDIQKIGGMEALEGSYLQVPLAQMIKKRAGWLAALFLGEMLTASAMGHFEAEIARAVVLALFVPLIISSGGNSGSQATTLIIRAMSLREIRLRDWWRVVRREVFTGVGLGCILAVIGFTRILLWQGLFDQYGEHYLLIASTVSLSLIGVVLWGTLAGSMLPFILRSLRFDAASASAPFVATLVDVTGLIIYFTVAKVVLRGALL
jgi:magnesium transporter